MNGDQDNRIAELLRAEAPAAHDPLFRVQVLERREVREFQRRSRTLLAGALLILPIAVLAGLEGEALGAPGLLVVGVGLASGYFAFRHRFLRILRRFSI